jgi:Family of unknown function (DUF6502)
MSLSQNSSASSTVPGASAAVPQSQQLGLAAFEEIAQPLAQFLISQGIQLPAALEILKAALVRQAVQSFASDERATTDTRVAVLTGVHRKDVRRLRAEPSGVGIGKADPLMSVASYVVARWVSEPKYQIKGQPMALPRTSRYAESDDIHFAALVVEVSRDVGARAVLDELLRLEVVNITEDDKIQLRARSFVPKQGVRESLHFLAANVRDHLATAVSNMQSSAQPQLEQSAFSQGLSKQQAQQLHELARGLWQKALQKFLMEATVAETNPSPNERTQYRVRFGTYFHQAAMSEPLQPKASRSSARKK